MFNDSAGARPTEAPQKNFTWGPLFPQAKWFLHRIPFSSDFAAHAFVRFLMNEAKLDGYKVCQPCKTAETFIIVET